MWIKAEDGTLVNTERVDWFEIKQENQDVPARVVGIIGNTYRPIAKRNTWNDAAEALRDLASALGAARADEPTKPADTGKTLMEVFAEEEQSRRFVTPEEQKLLQTSVKSVLSDTAKGFLCHMRHALRVYSSMDEGAPGEGAAMRDVCAHVGRFLALLDAETEDDGL